MRGKSGRPFGTADSTRRHQVPIAKAGRIQFVAPRSALAYSALGSDTVFQALRKVQEHLMATGVEPLSPAQPPRHDDRAGNNLVLSMSLELYNCNRREKGPSAETPRSACTGANANWHTTHQRTLASPPKSPLPK